MRKKTIDRDQNDITWICRSDLSVTYAYLDVRMPFDVLLKSDTGAACLITLPSMVFILRISPAFYDIIYA